MGFAPRIPSLWDDSIRHGSVVEEDPCMVPPWPAQVGLPLPDDLAVVEDEPARLPRVPSRLRRYVPDSPVKGRHRYRAALSSSVASGIVSLS